MIYKISVVLLFGLLFAVGSLAAEIETKDIDNFLKTMVDLKSPEAYVSENYEVRMIDGYKTKQVQKTNEIYEAEIEFNVVSLNKRDEKTHKVVTKKLPQPRKETMKYRFVILDGKLMLSEAPHPFSYLLKTVGKK